MDEIGLENSAILLMSLGEEDAAQVLKHLTPKEVQGVGEMIGRFKTIPRERMNSVLEKFAHDYLADRRYHYGAVLGRYRDIAAARVGGFHILAKRRHFEVIG